MLCVRKEGYYLIVVLFTLNEFFDFCVPDALPITYAGTYIISFLAVVLFRLIQGFLNLGDSSVMNTVYILPANFVPIIMYALDVFVYNVKPDDSYLPRPTLSMVVETVQIQGIENPMRESLKEGIQNKIINSTEIIRLSLYMYVYIW